MAETAHKKATKAKHHAKKSAKRQQRRDADPTDDDDPKNYWRGHPRHAHIGEDRFRIFALRPPKATARLDGMATSVEWTDASAILQGTTTLTIPRRHVDLNEGDRVVLASSHREGAPFKERWRMRLYEPETSYSGGTLTLQLADDLARLKIGTDDFIYKASKKKKPHGWYYHEIIQDIARRYGFKVHRLIRGTHRIKNFTMRHTSPFDAIVAAAKKEKTATNQRMRLGWEAGGLVIDPLRRSKDLLELRDGIVDATLHLSLLLNYANDLTVKATLKGKKGKRKKHEIQVQSRRAVQRYGRIHSTFNATDASTEGEARRDAREELAKRMEVQKTLTVSHVGIPSLRRLDAVRILIPEDNVRFLCYVTEVRHSLQAGDYSMDVTLKFTDPFIDVVAQKAREKRCKTARQRGRKRPGDCQNKQPGKDKKSKTTRKHAQRSDRP